MKCLVIGGAGYIGSHIVYELNDLGHEVTIFDNLSSGLEINIDNRANFIKGDILNKDDLKNCLKDKNFDIVFHFAAFKAAGESMIDPGKYSENNITGTINILNAMLENNIKYIVFSSSAAVYGSPKYLPIDEDHPLNPENYYGFTKLKIEEIMDWYSKLKNFNFAALRYFNAAGYDIKGRIKGLEKNPQNLFPIIMETLNGKREKLSVFGNDYPTDDGTCIRDYIHVTDLAKAHIKAMEYIINNKCNLIVNLGSETGNSVLDCIKKTEKATNKKVNYVIADRRPGDPDKLVASSKKAHELLNWKAEYSDMITIAKTMWQVYKNNG